MLHNGTSASISSCQWMGLYQCLSAAAALLQVYCCMGQRAHWECIMEFQSDCKSLNWLTGDQQTQWIAALRCLADWHRKPLMTRVRARVTELKMDSHLFPSRLIIAEHHTALSACPVSCHNRSMCTHSSKECKQYLSALVTKSRLCICHKADCFI